MTAARVVQLGDSGGAGEREAALLPIQPREARVRGDFYSDTAGAGLCLVMVTARTPCLPPRAAMEEPGPGQRRRSPSAAMAG